MDNYSIIKVGHISPAKLRRAAKGATIRLTNAELSGDRVMIVHPLNFKAISSAKRKGKGSSAQFTAGEINADLQYHSKAGGSLQGSSVWSFLKNAARDVYGFGKDNWQIIKPIASAIADKAVPAGMSFLGQPAMSGLARASLKKMTGIGLKKGSPEMASKMAALRAKRKSGGSFMIN